MIQNFQNLGLVLERMIVLYERVIDLLERERNFLILLDFENLHQVMREKDELLGAIRALDKDRLRIQDICSIVMGLDGSQTTLRTMAESLIEAGSADVGQRLLTLRTQLAAIVEALQMRIQRNRRFTEKSIESLQKVASHLSSSLGGKKKASRSPGTYTGKAKYAEKTETTGSIVEKRL